MKKTQFFLTLSTLIFLAFAVLGSRLSVKSLIIFAVAFFASIFLFITSLFIEKIKD